MSGAVWRLERGACRVLGQHRSTQRKIARTPDDEERLTADIIALARPVRPLRLSPHHGVSTSGGLGRQRQAGRADLAAGGAESSTEATEARPALAQCTDRASVLRAEHPNHVWSYDFVEDRTHDGRKYRMLNIIDEFTRECLAIRIDRKLKSTDVIDVLSDLFMLRGVPGYVRSDNGAEFVATAVQDWIAAVGAKTAYIEPGSPWENGYCESFNSKLRDELLNGEIFYTLAEARIIIESWRQHYNEVRPHSSLGYKPPAPEVLTSPRPAAHIQSAPPGALSLAWPPILN